MSNRSYNFVKNYGDMLNITNTIKFNTKTINIINDRTIFNDLIFKALDANKKISIPCMSEKEAIAYEELLKLKYPHLNIVAYTGKTDDTMKKNLNNISNIWCNLDVVIYTPTIEAGVSFDKERFTAIFGIISSGSCSQRSYFQMMARIRKINNDDIYLFNNSSLKINYTAKEWTHEAVKNAICENKSLYFSNHSIIYKYDKLTKAIIPSEEVDEYENLFYFNQVENYNKDKYYFLKIFKQIAISKGFKFKIQQTNNNKKITTRNDDKIDKFIIINKVLNSDDINNNEYKTILLKQKKDEATTEEKYKVDKYTYKINLGVEKLNVEILDKFYKKKHLINNLISLIDVDNLIKTNTPQDEIKFNKNVIINDLIDKIGLAIGNDKIEISYYILDSKLKILIITHPFFNDSKSNKLLFNYHQPGKLDTFKKLLGFINSILSFYSLKISPVRKYLNKSKNIYVYKLTFLNGADEIIKFKNLKGHMIHDKHNIFFNELGKLKNNQLTVWHDLIDDQYKIQNNLIDFDHNKPLKSKYKFDIFEDEDEDNYINKLDIL